MAQPTYLFFMDDSGSRRPDRHRDTDSGVRWNFFGLGGVLVREDDEAQVREAHLAFCQAWNISAPLHSVEIRHKSHKFAWIGQLSEPELSRFYSELSALLISLPVIGFACVIDRDGYFDRYYERYGTRRWHLCKTAFCILIERVAKYVSAHGGRVRILPERSNEKDERRLNSYYDALRTEGMPFDRETSSGYSPLDPSIFSKTLFEFRHKAKTSPLIQVADLYLWPMGLGGYRPDYQPYASLKAAGKLIDCILEPDQVQERGIKYSCFDSVRAAG